MTILIDILHPAHVHFFKNVYWHFTRQGHRVLVTAREKEISIDLLSRYGIEFVRISRQRTGLGLIWEMIYRSCRLFWICLRFRPQILMGIMGPSIAVVGFLLRIPAWVFYDTENAKITNWFAYPLAQRVYSPACYLGKIRQNQVLYPGYHELAYLHPNFFTPDPSVLVRYGIQPNSVFFVVRFVGWKASHDLGESGIPDLDKIRMVHLLEKYGKTYITSETGIPEQISDRKLNFPLEHVHHLLSFARLVVGESATMASEAAVLGTPAIFISDTSRGYTLEEERDYKLVCNFTNRQIPEALKIIDEIASGTIPRETFSKARAALLRDKVDVTAYMISQINKCLEDKSCAA